MATSANLPDPIDMTQVTHVSFHSAEPVTKIPMRLESIRNEGTIMESRTYMPVDPGMTLHNGEAFEFVWPDEVTPTTARTAVYFEDAVHFEDDQGT